MSYYVLPSTGAISRRALSRRGAVLGLKWGCILAPAYSAALMLLDMIISAMQDNRVIVTFAVVGVGMLLSIPCGLLGALTGWLVGLLLYRVDRLLSRIEAGGTGLGVALALACLVHLPFFSQLKVYSLVGYLLLLGAPSVIYLVASVPLAIRLNAKVTEATGEHGA